MKLVSMLRLHGLRLIALMLFFTLSLSIHAKIAECRTEKEIKQMVKNKVRSNQFVFSAITGSGGSKIYEFVELSAFDDEILNITEKALKSIYPHVAFCFNGGNIHHAYWVKDDKGNIGLVKFDGEVLVPPINGCIQHATGNLLVVGETEYVDPNDWRKQIVGAIYARDGRGIGHAQAVVDKIKSDDVRAIIPYGEYDDIMIAIKGTKFDFLVAKQIGDELRWGVTKQNGELYIPCDYRAIYKKPSATRAMMFANVGGGWFATNEMNMDEANSAVENRIALIESRRKVLAETLNSTGNSIISLASNIETIQNIPEESSDYTDTSVSDIGRTKKSKSGNIDSNNKYDMSEQVDYNRDKSTYNKYDGMLSKAFAGNTSASQSEIYNWQSKMRELRKKWEKKGRDFPHSSNEDK